MGFNSAFKGLKVKHTHIMCVFYMYSELGYNLMKRTETLLLRIHYPVPIIQ